ncbi:peptidase family M1-domain-containing protein [Dipodascopsis tothii]|uniref:peptidase family M1-domain-containing protein n=1 Tax=Dipodascopsis tothii TaxID=44089 RepID=UPI0034CDE8B8
MRLAGVLGRVAGATAWDHASSGFHGNVHSVVFRQLRFYTKPNRPGLLQNSGSSVRAAFSPSVRPSYPRDSQPRNQRAFASSPSRRRCQHHYRLSEFDAPMLNTAATDAAGPEPARQILPQNVRPTHYDVTLEPDFDKFTFEGEVAIVLDVLEASNTVTLNALELTIHSATVTVGGLTHSATAQTADEDAQSIAFTFPVSFTAGSRVTFTSKFTGILNDKMAGFYRSSYTDADGSTKFMATTQMEPTDCRRAFPSFDEPALKATFTIALVADKHLTCLSNMDVHSETEVAGGKKRVLFNRTPQMSSYLLAFIVGELKYVETTSFRIPVRVYAPAGMEAQGQFSSDLAAKTIKFFEETFDMPYPLPKMDMVAIPDFSAGAMENWGLITYRVVDLLFDEETSGAATKQRVAEVVQHELAHQWFGNLVTMDWWEGLWLNEGFATWMSWFSCNEFYPDWKVWETYVTDNLQAALRLDGLRSSHPIEVPVKRADEINQIFDAISYSKGSCVLRMVSKFLGEDVFIAGVRVYLKRHQYGNTQTSDLWDALSEVSGKDVSSLMASWTKQIGYPVLTVTEVNERTIRVRQNRFLTSGDVKPEEDKVIFPVSLALRTADGVDESLMLNEREATIEIADGKARIVATSATASVDAAADVSAGAFFKVNADHSGIYRVAYPPKRLARLGADAAKGLLSVEDRAGLVADAGALAASGYASTTGLLSLVSEWKNEDQFVVWDEITARIAAIRSAWLFEDKATRDALKKFQLELTAPKAKELGWSFDGDVGHVEQQFKALMFGSAGLAGDAEVIAAAQDLFKRFAAGDKKALHPNLKASVFAIALQNGGEHEWQTILNTYLNPVNTDERNTALRQLGRTTDPVLMEKTLALILDGSVKAQDVYLPMGGLRASPEGTIALWNWVKAHWDELERMLPPGLSMLSSVVSLSTGGFSTAAAVADVEEFFANRATKGYDKGLAQSLESIRSKIAWVERDDGVLKQWLQENGYY